MAPKMSWRMSPPIFGLCFITLSPGIAGMNSSGYGTRADKKQKALVETAALAVMSAYLTRSFWPIVTPGIYLAFNYGWDLAHGIQPDPIGD